MRQRKQPRTSLLPRPKSSDRYQIAIVSDYHRVGGTLGYCVYDVTSDEGWYLLIASRHEPLSVARDKARLLCAQLNKHEATDEHE